MRLPLIILIPIVTTGALIAKNTELAPKIAKEKNPVLMKILQTVETATSDERLFDVSLKLLKSLCVCMRETLKIKQMDINGFGDDTNALQVGNVEEDSNKRVMELYQNIYNKTCFDLRDDLVGNVKAKTFNSDNGDFVDPNCDKKSFDKNTGQYQVSSTLLPEIKNDYVQLKDIMFKTFIEMRDNHKFFVKRYNLFSTPSKFSLDSSKHSIIVLLTLNSVKEIYKMKNSTEIKSDELDVILKSQTRVDIDLIDARYGSKENNSFESLIPKAASNCTLKSIYIFVLQNVIQKNIKVFKLLRKKDSIKVYIDIPTEIHHIDYSRICCDDDTKLYYCKIDISKKNDSQKITTPQSKVKKRKMTGNYKDTISKIKTLVKLYDKKIKNYKLDTLHMEPQKLTNTDFIQVITKRDNNLKLTEENYHNSAVLPTNYNMKRSTLWNVVNKVKELHKTIKVPDKSSVTAEKYLNNGITYNTTDGMKMFNYFEKTLAPGKNNKTFLDIDQFSNKKPFNHKQTETDTSTSRYTYSTNSHNTEDYTYAKLLDTVPDISRNQYKVSDIVSFLNTELHRPRSTKNKYVEIQNEKYKTHFNQITKQLDGNGYLQELNETDVNFVNETPSMKPMEVNSFGPNTSLTTNLFATAENFKTVRSSTSNQHNTEGHTQYSNTKPNILRNQFTSSDVLSYPSNTIYSTSKYIEPLDVPVSTPEIENQNKKYTIYSNNIPQPIDSYLQILNTTDNNDVSETRSVIFTEKNNIKLKASTYPTKNYKENFIEKRTTLPMALIPQNTLKYPFKNNITTDIPIQITNTDLQSDYFIKSKSINTEEKQSRGSVEKPEITKSVIPSTFSKYLEQSMAMEQSENHFQQDGNSFTIITNIRNKVSDPATQINAMTNNIGGENIIHTIKNYQTSPITPAITNAITFKKVQEKRMKDNGINVSNFKTISLLQISHKEDKNKKNLELIDNVSTGKNDKYYYVTESAFIESPYEADSFTNADSDYTKKDIMKPNKRLEQSEDVFGSTTIFMKKANILNEHVSKKMSDSPNITTSKVINHSNTLTTIQFPFKYDITSKSRTSTESVMARVFNVSSRNKDVMNENFHNVTTSIKNEYSGNDDTLTCKTIPVAPFEKDNEFHQNNPTINTSQKIIPHESKNVMETQLVSGITDNILSQMDNKPKVDETITNNKYDFFKENYGSKQVSDVHLTFHEQVNTNYLSFQENDNINNSMISPTRTTATIKPFTDIAEEIENNRAFITTESFTITHESNTTKTKNTKVKKHYRKNESTKNHSLNYITLNSTSELTKATTENYHNNTVESVIKGSVTEVLYSKNRNIFQYLATEQHTLNKTVSKNANEVTSTYQVEHYNNGDMIFKEIGKTNSHYITRDTDLDKKYQIDNSSATPGLNNSDLSSKPEVTLKYKKLQVKEYKQSDTQESVTKESAAKVLVSKNQPPSTLLDYSSTIKEQPLNTKITKDTNEVTSSYQVEHNNMVVNKKYNHHLSNAQKSNTIITMNTDIEKDLQNGKSSSTPSVNESSISEFTKVMTTSDSMKYKMFKVRDNEQRNIKENVTKSTFTEKIYSKNQTTSLLYSSTTRNQHFNKKHEKYTNKDALSDHVGHNNIGPIVFSDFGSTKSDHLSGELISISLIPLTDNSKATKLTGVSSLRENKNTKSRQDFESTHNIVAGIVTNNNFISETSLKLIPLKEPVKMKEKKINENMEKNHSHYIPKISKVHNMNITSLLTYEKNKENIEEHTNVQNIFLELKSLITAEPNVIRQNLIQFDDYKASTVNFINKKQSESEKHFSLNKDDDSSPSNDYHSHSMDMHVMNREMGLKNIKSNTESYYNSITNTDYMPTSEIGIKINYERPINAKNKNKTVIEVDDNIEQNYKPNFIITTSNLPSKLDEIMSELKSMISVEPISINEIEPFKIVKNENVTFNFNEINSELDMELLTPEIYNHTQNSDGIFPPTIVTIEPKSVTSTGALIQGHSNKLESYEITKKVDGNTKNTDHFEKDRVIHSTTYCLETPNDIMSNRSKTSFYDDRADMIITDDPFKENGTIIPSKTNFSIPDDIKVSQKLNRIKTSFHDDLNDTQSSEHLEEDVTVILNSENSPSIPDDFEVLQILNTNKSSFHDDQSDFYSANNFKEDITVIPITETSDNTPDDFNVLQMLNRIKNSFHDDGADSHSTDDQFKQNETVIPRTTKFTIPNDLKVLQTLTRIKSSFHDDQNDTQSSNNSKENTTVIPNSTNSPRTPDDFNILQMLNTNKSSFHDGRGDSQSTNHFKEDIKVIPVAETSPNILDDLKILQLLNTIKSSFRDDRGDSHSTDNFKGNMTTTSATANMPNMQDDLNVIQILKTNKSSFYDDRADFHSTTHFKDDTTVIPNTTNILNMPDDFNSFRDAHSTDHFKEDLTVIPNITNSPNTPDDLNVLQMLNSVKISFHDHLNETQSSEDLEEDITGILNYKNSHSTPDDLKVLQMLNTIKSSLGNDPAYFQSTDSFKEDTTVIPNTTSTPNIQDNLKVLQMLNRMKTSSRNVRDDHFKESMTIIPSIINSPNTPDYLQVWQMLNKIKNSFHDDRTDFDTTESNLLENTSLALYTFTKPQNNTVLIEEMLLKTKKENKDYDSNFDLTQTTTMPGNFILGQPTRINSGSTKTSSRVLESTETDTESLKLDSNIPSNILKEGSKTTLKSYSANVATQFGQNELTTISPIEIITHHPSTIHIYFKNADLHKTTGKDEITDIPVEESSSFEARTKTGSNVNSKSLSIFTTETLPNILKAEDNYDTTEIPQKYTDYSTQVISMNNSPFLSNLNINNELTNNIFEATILGLDRTLNLNNHKMNTYRNLPYRSNDIWVTRQQSNFIQLNEVLQLLDNKMKLPTKSNLSLASTPSLQIVTNDDKNENTQPTKQLIKDSALNTEPINELQTSIDNKNDFSKEDVKMPMSNTKPDSTAAFQLTSSLYISDRSPLYVQNNLQNVPYLDETNKSSTSLNVQNNSYSTETPMNFDDDVITQKFVQNLTSIIIGNMNNEKTPSTHHVLSREVTKAFGENFNSPYPKISKGRNFANNKNKLFSEANSPSENSQLIKTDNIIFNEKSNSRYDTNKLFINTSVLDIHDNFEEKLHLTSKFPITDLKYMNDSDMTKNKNEIESTVKDKSHINNWSSVEVNDKIELLNNNLSLIGSSIMITSDKNTNFAEIRTVAIADVNDGIEFPNMTPKISSIYEINDTVEGFSPTETYFTISVTENFSKNKSDINARPNIYIEQSETEFKNVTCNKDNNSESDITTEYAVTNFESKLSAEHDMDLQSRNIALSLNSEKSNLILDRTIGLEYNNITTIKQSVTSLEMNNHSNMKNNIILVTGTDIVTKLNDDETLLNTSSSTENALNELNQVELNKTISPLDILNQFLTRSDQSADINTTIPKYEKTTVNANVKMTYLNEGRNIISNIDSELKIKNNDNIVTHQNLIDMLMTKETSNLNINSVLPVYVENINGTLNMVPKNKMNVNDDPEYIESTVRSEVRSSPELKNMKNDYIFLTNDPGDKVYKDTYFYNSEIFEDISPSKHTEIYSTDRVKDIDLSTLVLPENEVLLQNDDRKPSLQSQLSTTNYSTTELNTNDASKEGINENFKRTTKEYNDNFKNTLHFPSMTSNEITSEFNDKTEYDKTKTIKAATATAKAVKTEIHKDFFNDKNNMGTAKDTSTKISYENYFNVTMLSELNLSNELISDTSGSYQEYSNVRDNNTIRTDSLDTTTESKTTANGLRNTDADNEFEGLTTSTNNFSQHDTPVMKKNDDEKIFSTTVNEDSEKSFAENDAWQVIDIGAQLNRPAIGDGFTTEFTTEFINITDNMKTEGSFSKDFIFTKSDSKTYENYIKQLKNTSTEISKSKINTVIHDLSTRSNIDIPFELTKDSSSKDYNNIKITLFPNNILSPELTITDSNFTNTHFQIFSDIRTSIDTSSLPRNLFSEHKLSTVNESNMNITEITSKNEHMAINDSYIKSTSPMSNKNNVSTVMLSPTEKRINTDFLEAANSGKKLKTTLDDIHYGNKDTTNEVYADVHNEHEKATDHTPENLILNEVYSFGQSSSEKPKKILKMEETETTKRTMGRHLTKMGFNINENANYSVLDTIFDNRLVTSSTVNENNNQNFEKNEPEVNKSNSQSFLVAHDFTNINVLNVTDLTARNDNINNSCQLNKALSIILPTSNNDEIFNVYPSSALSTYNNPINPNNSIGTNQQYNIDHHTIIHDSYDNTTEDRIKKSDYTTTRSVPFLVNYNNNTKNEDVISVKKINRPESIKTTVDYETIDMVNPDIYSIPLLDNNNKTEEYILANQQNSTKALSAEIIQTEHLQPTSITILSTENRNPVVKYLKDTFIKLKTKKNKYSEAPKLNVLNNYRFDKFKQLDHFRNTKNISNVLNERQNQGIFVKVCVNEYNCNTTKINKIQKDYKLKNRLDHSSGNTKNKKQIFNHSKLIKKIKFKGVDKEITHRNISITTNLSLIHTNTNNVEKLKGNTNFEKTDRHTVNNIHNMSSRRQVSKLNISNLFQSKDVHVTTYPLTKTTKEIVYNTYRPTTEEEIDPPTLDKILSTLPILTKKSKKERHEFKHNMKHVIHNNKFKNEIPFQSRMQDNAANKDKLSKSGEKTRLYPVNSPQKPQKTVMKRIKVGNRKSDIIEMNTDDFFSRRRAIESGDKLYNILRLHPKSEKIHQETKLPRQVTDLWLDDMYLKVRLPLPINSNPGMVFPKRHFAKMDEVADLAALFIDDLLDYKEMLDRGELPLERATSREKGQPLCMEQFYKLLGVCRIPQQGKDRLELPPMRPEGEPEELVIVACRNYFYPIPVKAADRGRLTPGEIQAQLLSAMVDATGAPAAPRVGLLTALGRDQWANARELLCADDNNRWNLELMSRALCVMCLDEGGGGVDDTAALRRAMHGAGAAYHSANRWFDKTVQLIIASDGMVGMCYEHSAAEGVAVVRLAERALARAAVAARPAPPPALLPAPQAMPWTITPAVEKIIDAAAKEVDRNIADLDVRVWTYSGYGRDFMKSCRTSPDVYIQLALQFAYYKMYGYLVSTYESASLRRFRQGRVDNIRSAHAQAKAWAAEMCADETPPASDADDHQKKEQKKLQLFEEAAKKQTAIMEAVIQGRGIDNHLLGLREVAVETMGQLPELFTDPTYKQMNEFKLSTSQVATTTDGTFMGYGAVVPDGYGCSYNPKKDSVIFCISSFVSSSVTNTEAFRQSLEEALESMKLMFQNRQTAD